MELISKTKTEIKMYKCPLCDIIKPEKDFISKFGKIVKVCIACRKRLFIIYL